MGFVPSLDLRGNRVLIFIVAYNAETTIEEVLEPHSRPRFTSRTSRF